MTLPIIPCIHIMAEWDYGEDWVLSKKKHSLVLTYLYLLTSSSLGVENVRELYLIVFQAQHIGMELIFYQNAFISSSLTYQTFTFA